MAPAIFFSEFARSFFGIAFAMTKQTTFAGEVMRGVMAAAAVSVLLASCKPNVSESALLDEQPTARKVTVHGQVVTGAKYDEILLALGSQGASTDGDTLIASADDDSFEGFSLADSAYMAKCRQAGVPIPPPWLDGTGAINPLWKPITTLDASRIFALDPRLETTLYAYRDPGGLGVCAALPRALTGRAATEVVALGIICQGVKSSKACFWDNKEPSILDQFGNQVAITDTRRIIPEKIADGDNLVENCAACHRGGNIFVIHGGTGMEKLPDRMPDKPPTPISSQVDWDNELLKPKIAQNCQGNCHYTGDAGAFPEFNAEYCLRVMMPSIKSRFWIYDDQAQVWFSADQHNGKGPTMPPASENPADYATDIAEIAKECKKIVEGDNLVWPWGAKPTRQP